MVPPKQVQDIAVHFDNLLGYGKCNSVLIDGHYLPVQEVTLVEGSSPPGYIQLRISMSRVRLVTDPDPDDEID